jgi:hypothetical protein
MARSNEKVTPQEFKTFEKFFAENPQWDTAANGDSFSTYLLETWQVDITPETLAVAARQLTEAGRLEVLSPVQVRYLQISRQHPDAARRVSDWYENQRALVKDDQDKSLENQTALLLELRGREITSTNIQAAMGRVGHRNGLHYVPTPLRVDPRQHSDSGAFMPRDQVNLSAREAAKARQSRTETTPASASTNPEPDSWKSLCDQLLGDGRHSQKEAMRQLYEARGSRSWRELYASMKQLQQSYQRLFNPKAV